MPIEYVDVAYCEGWDPEARAAAGPLTAEAAAGRHRTGEQYAVLLSAGGRPAGMIEVATGDSYVGAWFMDSGFRRVSEVDCRIVRPGRLFVLARRTGPQETPGKWLRAVEASTDGLVRESETVDGGLRVTVRNEGADDCWIDLPEFGDWATFIRAFPGALEAAGLDVPEGAVVRDVSVAEGSGLPAARRPWHAPRGLAPDPSHLARLFTAGTRLSFRGHHGEETFTVEVREAGTLRLASGRVIAVDPYWISADDEPFTATVAPGSYPVQVSVASFEDDPRHQRVAAARLVIRDVPVESWEMALKPGQDPRLLQEGEFFGFGVDAGLGCFFDASRAVGLADRGERDPEWLEEFGLDELAFTVPGDGPGDAADLVGYHSGWGDGAYPVWVGRAADGEVACFVADLLLIPGAHDVSHT